MNKKFLKSAIFLAGCCTLVGCSSDTIVARPSWINEKILIEAGDKDNKMKAIYDAVKKLGDTNSAVLNRVMYDIAKSNIGKFVKEDSDADTDLTLSEIHDSYDKEEFYTSEKFKKFVADHPIYKAEDNTSYLVGTTVTKHTLEEKEKLQLSAYKANAKYEQILSDIYENIYNEIKGGSYSDSITKIFKEEYYVDHLRKELYDVGSYGTYITDMPIFVPKEKDEDWKTHTGKYITVDKDRYDDYVKRKILPELYKTYLTETYVKEQRYSSLGRSYARKVNMVSVPYTTANDFQVLNMLKYYAKTYITSPESGEVGKDNFEYITQAMTGFVGVGETRKVSLTNVPAYELLNHLPNEEQTNDTDVNFISLKRDTDNSKMVYKPYSTEAQKYIKTLTEYTGEEEGHITTYVYKGTKLGDLVEKLIKCCDVDYKSGTTAAEFTLKTTTLEGDALTAYNDITSNGKYSLELGMEIKERELLQTDLTTDGWYLKNGGLTDLDSKFRDRLFNIKTSSEIDFNKDKEYASKDYVRYFGTSTRRAFLTTTTSSTQAYDTIVLHNEAGTNKYMYIVEVEEAPSTSKLTLNPNNKDSYLNLKATTDVLGSAKSTNKIVSDVVKANSTSDTYKKNANQYYLMISNIVFYDQSVYDYFKSQFPDLFK